MGFGDDQNPIVRRDRHAIRKRDAVGDLANRTGRGHERDDAGTAVDVGIAAPVDDDFVPELIRNISKINVRDERSIVLASDDSTLPSGDDQEPSVRKPIDAEGQLEGRAHDHLRSALRVDGQNLLRTPIREPEAILMPARGFAHRDAAQERGQIAR